MRISAARRHPGLAGNGAGHPPGWTRRLASLALVLVHLLVGMAATAADARAAGDLTTEHIESSTDRPCSPGHDHASCEFCRLLGSLSGYAPPPPVADPATALASTAPATFESLPRIGFRFAPVGPRAPPLAFQP